VDVVLGLQERSGLLGVRQGRAVDLDDDEGAPIAFRQTMKVFGAAGFGVTDGRNDDTLGAR